MHSSLLRDNFGRPHDYLRISLTDACNLRCVYCMPNEKILVTPSAKLMQEEEIEGIARVFVKLGVKRIRLTGGEPLVRKDAKQIILRLGKLPVDLSISTNGVFVDEYIESFKEAKISSINFSLDTLNAGEFLAITKRGDFETIMKNIHLALSNNFKVKLNMVVMKGINEHAVTDFVKWTKDFPLDVRFIEFMPFKGNEWILEKVFSYKEMLGLIGAQFDYEKIKDEPNDTAKKYKVKDFKGTFGFITTITEPFCGSCNRLRLTADGRMKNCLFSHSETDLLSAWRNGEDIEPLILACLKNKKEALGGKYDFNAVSVAKTENRSMVRIGG